MVITLGEASRQTGKSKAAITKAIKTGRLSAAKGDTGDWQIDPAELFRVYTPASEPENRLTAEVNPDFVVETAVLRRELELLRERLDDKNSVIADIKQDRDFWRQQATALLTDQTQRPPERKGWRGFLHRLTG
jgi:hypothetical protein